MKSLIIITALTLALFGSYYFEEKSLQKGLGISSAFEFEFNVPKQINNPLFFKVTGGCSVFTGQGDAVFDLLISGVKGSVTLNGALLKNGDTIKVYEGMSPSPVLVVPAFSHATIDNKGPINATV